jgi:hypothetical protein
MLLRLRANWETIRQDDFRFVTEILPQVQIVGDGDSRRPVSDTDGYWKPIHLQNGTPFIKKTLGPPSCVPCRHEYTDISQSNCASKEHQQSF